MPKNDPDTTPTTPPMVMPVEVGAMLISAIEKLLERLDQNPGDDDSLAKFQQILETHGEALKGVLRPENRLHPDVSWYNPDGERDHPRPRLRRPCYFLGLPLEQPTLSKREIELLNRFDRNYELPSKRWVGRILRDAGGSELLYLSVPFKDWDDLRHVGGLADICSELLDGRPIAGERDDLLERIARLESALAARVETPLAPLPASPAADTQAAAP